MTAATTRVPRRVLLLHPGALYGGRWASVLRAKPGLVSLWSCLRAHRVPVEVLDLQVEFGNPGPEEVGPYLDRAAEAVLSREFDLLAVSCWSSLEYLASVELARRVRDAAPDVPIVVGGYHASALPQDFTVEGSPFNVVVVGEGELVLLELAKDRSLIGRHAPTVVSGRPLPLDRAPYDVAGYPYADLRREGAPLSLSRGCPFRCAFCMEAVVESRWRPVPVEAAVARVRAAVAAGAVAVKVCDACFGGRGEWRRAFLEALRREALDARLWVETRPDLLGARDVELLAGLNVVVNLGVETMSPAMAEVMAKATDGLRYVQRVAAILEALNERRVLTKVFLLYNHPGETATTAGETFDYARTFVERHDRLSVLFNSQPFAFFPGSAVARDLGRYSEQYGTVVGHPAWWTEREAHYPLATQVVATAGFTHAADYVARTRALFPEARAKLPPDLLLRLIAHAVPG